MAMDDMDNLLTLCKQKIIISRLRAAHGLSPEIPPLMTNGSLDFEAIDAKAMELVEHVVTQYGWTYREYCIDMSPFNIGEDGASLECCLVRPINYEDEESYDECLVDTLIECNPDIDNTRYGRDILYLIQNMVCLNGMFEDETKVVVMTISLPMKQITACGCEFGLFLQNEQLNSYDILQSGYDIIPLNDNVSQLCIFMVRNCFMSGRLEVANSYSYGFNWDYLDCFKIL